MVSVRIAVHSAKKGGENEQITRIQVRKCEFGGAGVEQRFFICLLLYM